MVDTIVCCWQVMRYRRGDAYTSSQVFYERVNSQVTTTVFDYTHFGVIDASKRLVHLEKHPATKIRFSRKFSFACPLAEESFHQQRNEFLEEHQRIDDYLEFTEGLDLLNVRFDDQTVALSNPCHRPWYLYTWVFWVASLVLLSYPLRLIIGYKTAHVHYQVHKIFGVDRGPDFMTRILIRGDAVAGQGVNGGQMMETAIRHNLSLAPSYAEALQLGQHRPRLFLDAEFSSYGAIPLLPLNDRKSSVTTAARPDGITSNATGNHVTGLAAAVGDDVRCYERSRVTRCVVTQNRVDVATVVKPELEPCDATLAVAPLTFVSVVDGSDEIRPDVMSECGNVVEDVRKRRGNDPIVARGQRSDENPDVAVAAQRRRRNSADTDEDCTTRTKTFQEMTAEEVTTQPEIDQHPVEEEGEEDGVGEGNESLGIRRIGEHSRPCEANLSTRSATSAGDLFYSSPVVTHLKVQTANNDNESLESSSFSNHLNRRALNRNGESRQPAHHLNDAHRYDVSSGCQSTALEISPLTSNAVPSDNDAVIDLIDFDLINEAPPSYEDALRMRRFVLPVTTGSGQNFQNQAKTVDEFDEDSIGSPGHLSNPDFTPAGDHGDYPSRSRAAVVIQVMETSL